MDKNHIDAIAALAVDANGLPTNLSHRLVSLPATSKLNDLERYMPLRERFRGEFSTSSLDAFAAYVKARAADGAAQLFVADTDYKATAFFNLGTQQAPGHGDDTAHLELPRTAAMNALIHANGRRFSQRDLIEFIEDWAPQLRAIAQGEDGEAMPLQRALAAIREVTITKSSEVTNRASDFGERRSALDEIEAKAAVGLPAFFDMTVTPCLGLTPRTFRLRVAVLTGSVNDGKPVFTLKAVGYEVALEEVAAEFGRVVADRVGDAGVAYQGEFKP